jgi:uncharacterized protein
VSRWRFRTRLSRRTRWLIRLGVLLLAAGYLKFVGLDSKFYYPDDVAYVEPAQLGVCYEDVHFRTADGLTLHGWFLPASTAPAKGVVVHFHGNAANVSAHLALVSWLPERGYHTLLFDYRGFGKSEGRVSRAGTIRDGHAALDYVLAREDPRGLPVFFYGQSLGGAVAMVVAAERPEVAGVVAESTFSGYRKIAALHVQRLVRVGWLARALATVAISGGHDPIDVVGRLSPRPVLVIGAENDQICFPEMSRELFEAAGEPKWFWLAPRAEHLGILEEYPRELPERICGFFEGAAPR